MKMLPSDWLKKPDLLKTIAIDKQAERQDLQARLIRGDFPHRPTRLTPAKKSFWAMFGKKSSPFDLKAEQVESWLDGVRRTHAPRTEAMLESLRERGPTSSRPVVGGEEVSRVAGKPADQD